MGLFFTQSIRSGKRRRRWGIAVILLVAVVRLTAVRGWIRPVQVRSGSMAPTLLGERYDLRCDDCFAPISVDATVYRPGEHIVCWNCGYRRNRAQPWQRQQGERVLIDAFPLWWRAPNRWEVVAFRSKDGTYFTKRVLAVPGEQLSFVDGDLWIDGKIVRKTLAQFRTMRVPVHDSYYLPTLPGAVRRWHADQVADWKRIDLGWRVSHGSATGGKVSWLEYRHYCAYAESAPPRSRTDEVPVFDLVPYNGNRSRVELHQVPDLLLVTSLRWSTDAVWKLRYRFPGGDFTATIDMPGRRLVLSRDGKPIVTRTVDWAKPRRRLRQIEWGMWDRQLMLVVDGEVILNRELALPGPLGSDPRPMAIGLVQGELSVARCKVFRDTYYFGPDGSVGTWKAPTPLASWFLAGDNQPASIDSRFRSDLPDDATLLGRVVRWPSDRR